MSDKDEGACGILLFGKSTATVTASEAAPVQGASSEARARPRAASPYPRRLDRRLREQLAVSAEQILSDAVRFYQPKVKHPNPPATASNL